jgi:hypothetical protein
VRVLVTLLLMAPFAVGQSGAWSTTSESGAECCASARYSRVHIIAIHPG